MQSGIAVRFFPVLLQIGNTCFYDNHHKEECFSLNISLGRHPIINFRVMTCHSFEFSVIVVG